MTREEKGATRYRAMFRHYPDALTPAQVRTPGQNDTLTVGNPTP